MRGLVDNLFNVPLMLAPDVALAFAFYEPGSADDGRGRHGAPYSVADGVATIPIHGELVNRASSLSSAFGITSYDALKSALRQAADDGAVRKVLLDIDSPGGEAAGAVETAEAVRALSKSKPVVAFVNALAASAAYAIAAGAAKIVVTPSATVGSIGIVWLHLDYSKALERGGLRPTLLHAGAHKVDGNSLQPLDPKPRARIQERIDDAYALFVQSVGQHRPALGAAGARATRAGVFMGSRAVEAKLADRVGSIETALALLSHPPSFAAAKQPKEAPMSYTTSSAQRASAPVIAHQSQEEIDATWGGIAAKLRAEKGLPPLEARGDPGREAALPPVRNAQPPLRRNDPQTQAEIDAMWSGIANGLNAALPPHAIVPARARGRA